MNTVTLLPGERLTVSNLGREGAVPAKITQAAANIIATVRAKGDAALHRYAAEFDGVDLTDFRVPQERIDTALEQVDASLIAALEKAAAQIRDFHQRQVRQSWFTTRTDGTLLGVQVTPVRAAGIYVPGGRAQYPSTVLMNAIPAKVAGVERVVMATPPQRDGGISPATLAAAKVAGATRFTWWAEPRPSPRSPTAPRASRAWRRSRGRATPTWQPRNALSRAMWAST